jgi:hypothetical protein
MTDQQPQPKISSAPMLGLQAMNATGAYFGGDRVGNALADIVAWIIAVQCKCAPPPDVITAVHDLSIALVMVAAIIAQHRLIKNLS